jgi:hypothetical protein
MILPGRHTAAHPDALVVFLIGARINRFYRPQAWLPVVRAMPAMLKELTAAPESGFMGYQPFIAGLRTVMMMQYWRDFDSLEAYARATDKAHWPAWTAFNRAFRDNDGAVGIFHETYAVAKGQSETIYVDMPSFGLGMVAGTEPATGSRAQARDRMRAE